MTENERYYEMARAWKEIIRGWNLIVKHLNALMEAELTRLKAKYGQNE